MQARWTHSLTILLLAAHAYGQSPTLVKDIRPNADSSFPFTLANVNGTLFFSARQPDGTHQLMISDGTTAGTVVVPIAGALRPDPDRIFNLNGTAFFRARHPDSGLELWTSDGLTTSLVPEPNPGQGDSFFETGPEFHNANGVVYFRATFPIGDGCICLGKTDGLTTTLVSSSVDVFSSEGALRFPINHVGNTVFFRGNDRALGEGWELYKTDGTTVQQVSDIWPGSNSGLNDSPPGWSASVNGWLFFSARNAAGGAGRGLYKTDGTAVVRIKSVSAESLTNVGGALLFVGKDGLGWELWSSGGADDGSDTAMVADINPGAGNSSPSRLTPTNGALFFTADDGSTGRELYQWTQSGGVVGLGDIHPSGSSNPENLTYSNGTLYFSAFRPDVGRELFQWTPAGGIELVDGPQGLGEGIAPGAAGSEPLKLTNVNGSLFFTADAPHPVSGTAIGRELWAILNTPASPGPVSVSPEDTNTGTTPVSLTFTSGTTSAGATTLTTGDTGPDYIEENFKIVEAQGQNQVDVLYYEISTSAEYPAGSKITVCIDYSAATGVNKNNLHLRHFNETAGVWEEPCPSTETNDKANSILCGDFTSLSPFIVVESVLEVAIDIKPSSDTNAINIGSKGNIPVAILGAADFDAAQVDPATVTLTGASVNLKGNGEPMASVKDVNGDGYDDLVVHVDTEASLLRLGDTEAVLEGRLFDKTAIRGTDIVKVIE